MIKQSPSGAFTEASGSHAGTDESKAHAEYTEACRRGGSPMEREGALLRYCEVLLRERRDMREAMGPDSVAEAMQLAWNDPCADAGVIPSCFRLTGRNAKASADFADSMFAKTVSEYLLAKSHNAELSERRDNNKT